MRKLLTLAALFGTALDPLLLLEPAWRIGVSGETREQRAERRRIDDRRRFNKNKRREKRARARRSA